MRRIFVISMLTAAVAIAATAQVKPRPKASPPPTPAVSEDPVVKNGGSILENIYRNSRFDFELVIPPTWYFAGRDFESVLKKDGIDLSVKAPTTMTPEARMSVNRSVKDLYILFTAFRADEKSKNTAILRVAAEDLKMEPGIKDAVDYLDAVRAAYKALPLPADFHYSETQAEQLGAMQFAFIDTYSKAGKKRVYATVRKGFAVIFALTYTSDEDLTAFRRVLEKGNFNLDLK